MIPQLVICKRKIHKRSGFETTITFVIVDGSKREPYPQNFVCIIPSSRTALLNDSPCREKLGGECLTVAQQLLTEAATNETDPVIVKEIKRRLKKLEK